ncbi:Rpn family recombination-promoting nuclease/putative transposase [bacterium]|nr:Rpn family recombination-promoting nuclease/putative transposase [bacterium]
MDDIHDRGYKKLFSNREIFRQLITTFVHEPWVKDLDFSTCELVKDSFISKRYKKTFTDLLYKIKLRGRDFYIVILLEFKATPQRFVALQMLGYIVDFYRHLVDSQKRLKNCRRFSRSCFIWRAALDGAGESRGADRGA